MAIYTSQYPPEHSGTYVKATSKISIDYWAYYATNPALSVIGASSYNSWASDEVTNQRFHIDLGSGGEVIRRIYYENFHDNGGITDYGAKDFTFWGSNIAASFADLIYGNDEGWTELTCSQNTFDKHIAGNQADPKYITVTNTTIYRYYALKFADNHDDPSFMGVRRIELQTEEEEVKRKNVIMMGSNF